MRSASFTSGTPSSTGAQTPVYGAPDNIASFSSLPTPGGSVRSLQVDTQAAPDIPAAGIGVVLQPCPPNGEMQVMELIPGGAAQQSNLICEGDLVTAVNQVSTRNKSLQEVSSLLVGPVGTTVSIGLIRVSDGMETATTATITRAALCRTGSQAALKRVTSSRGSSAANSRPPSRAGSVTRGQNAGAGTGGSSRDVSGAASPTSPPASNWDKVRASVQAQQSAGQLSKTGSVSSKTSTGSKGKYGLLKRWMSGKEIKRAEAAEDQLLEAQSVAAEAVAQVRLLEKQLEESQSQLQVSQRQLEESQRQLQESQGQVAKLRAELGEVTAERDEAVQAASILINEPELEGEEFHVLLSVLPDEEVRKMSNLSVNSSLLNTSATNSSIIREVLASRETQAATLSSETALFSGDILKDA
ncbi:MAG: PDZ domain-containing protein, partial [Promethearchaeia archaeon]